MIIYTAVDSVICRNYLNKISGCSWLVPHLFLSNYSQFCIPYCSVLPLFDIVLIWLLLWFWLFVGQNMLFQDINLGSGKLRYAFYQYVFNILQKKSPSKWVNRPQLFFYGIQMSHSDENLVMDICMMASWCLICDWSLASPWNIKSQS